MPRMDGTGPTGNGPTGRRMGPCKNSTETKTLADQVVTKKRFFGFGRNGRGRKRGGFGLGMGRRFGTRNFEN